MGEVGGGGWVRKDEGKRGGERGIEGRVVVAVGPGASEGGSDGLG